MIIQAFLDCLGFLCAIFVLPAKFCISVGRWFELKTRQFYTTHEEYWSLEALLWVPRCLVFDLSILLYCAFISLTSAIFFITHSIFAGTVSVLIVLSAFLYGNMYAKSNSWLRLWFPRGPLFGEGGVVPLLLVVHSGLYSFICLLWCILSVVRIPSLIRYYKMRNECVKTYKQNVKNEPQNNNPSKHEKRENHHHHHYDSDNNIEYNNHTSENDEDDDNKKGRSRALPPNVNDLSTQVRSEALMSIYDIFRYIFYILTPIWRYGEQLSSHRQVWSDAPNNVLLSWGSQHRTYVQLDMATALGQLLIGLTEVPIFALLIIVLPFVPWRINIILSAIMLPADDRRRAALRELAYSVADLASIAAGALLCFTWRGPPLIAGLWSLGSDASASARRRAVWQQYPKLLQDLMDVPCLLMGLFVVVTVWRFGTMCTELFKCNSRAQIRKVVRTQFFRCFVDVPASILFIVVCVSGWRAPNLIRRIHEEYAVDKQYNNGTDSDNEEDDDDYDDDDEAPPPPPSTEAKTNKMMSDWHKIVFSEAGQLLIDTPFPVLAILTLWRLPLVLWRIVTKCKTAGERRQVVLHQLWQVVKDIPCIVMVACLCLVGWWRLPGLIRDFRSYEPGDDAHRMVMHSFWAFLGDAPYAVAMLVAAILAFWRIPAMARDLRRCWSDSKCGVKEIRRLGIEYFSVMVRDYGCVVALLFTIGIIVRIPTYFYYIRHFHAEYSQGCKDEKNDDVDENAKDDDNNKEKHDDSNKEDRDWPLKKGPVEPKSMCSARKGVLTKTLYMSSKLIFDLFVLDIWLIFMIAFIFASIFHIPDLVKSYFLLLRLFRRGGHTQGESPQTIWHYNCGMKQRSYYYEGPDAPFSLTIFEPAISDHFFSAVRDLHHLIFLPLKLVAPLLYPMYLWIGYRSSLLEEASSFHPNPSCTPTSVTPSVSPSVTPSLSPYPFPSSSPSPNSSGSGRPNKVTFVRVTHSFIFEWAAMFRAGASEYADIWGAHIFSLRMVVSTVLTIANDIAAVLLICNVTFLFIATLGSPLWKNRVSRASPRFQRVLRVCVFVTTIIVVPLMVIADCLLLSSPLLYGYHNSFFGYSIKSLILWLYCIGILFLNCAAGASLVHMTALLSHARVFEWFAPAAAFSWGYDEILVGSILRWYSHVIERGTAWCYPYRSVRHLFLGEILLALLVGVWALWPLLVSLLIWDPWSRGQRLQPAVAAQCSIFLLNHARRTVSKQWALMVAGHRARAPGLKLTSLVPHFIANEKHGFAIEVRAKKPIDLAIRQARMKICGEQFWTTLSSAMGPLRISVFRNMYHPVTLCPAFLDPAPLSEGVEKVAVRFAFGTPAQPKRLIVSRDKLLQYLEDVVADGDPIVEVVIDYGTKFWNIWSIQGRLLTLRMRISALLEALMSDTPVNLLESGGAWVVSNDSADKKLL